MRDLVGHDERTIEHPETLCVSVVVVTKNEEKNIAACLDSLIKQDFPREKFEIIVVDGASTDKTRNICETYPVKLICLDRSSGISYQRNAGVQAAQGEYVAFLDADCVADKTWLLKLMNAIEKSEQNIAGVGGPNLVFLSDPPLSRVIGYAQQTFLGSGRSPQSYKFTITTHVSSIPNCNIIYKREIIAEEKYNDDLSIGDDCELNLRLKEKGYSFLFVPDIIVWHHRPSSLNSFVRKMFMYGEAAGRITRIRGKITRWYVLVAAIGVLTLVLSYPFALVLSYPFENFWSSLLYVYDMLLLIYAIVLGISTAEVYKEYGDVKSLLTILLLPLQHLFYGIGVWKGFLIG